MKRTWTSMKAHAKAILQLRAEGKTKQEIADELGLSKAQIKNWIHRNNRQEEKNEMGIAPKARKRKAAVSLQEYKYENKRLKMENELLRDFLHAAGRK